MIDYANLNAEYESLNQYTKQSMETVLTFKINNNHIITFRLRICLITLKQPIITVRLFIPILKRQSKFYLMT